MPNTFGATPQVDQFMDMRYGLFLHWNPSSVAGHEISWSREGDKPEIYLKTRGRDVSPRVMIPAELYDSLYKYFDARDFDAPALVAKAQDWGFKYIYLTTKHHDGFSNFDTAHNSYKVTAPECPAGRDLTKELADACHEAGMAFAVYYSQPDWHHPDYRTENHQNYIDYLHAQVEELCTKYGKIAAWWFDGLGGEGNVTGRAAPEPFYKPHDPTLWDAENLIKKMRKWQPDMVINDRCAMPCDFYTPEQRVGDYNPDEAWEATITLGDQWAYSFNEVVKTPETCINNIVDCATGGGNFVLNIGPDRHGIVPPEQERVLNTVGDWMKKYGHTIYGTRGGPYPRWTWGGSTHTGTTVYLHVKRWPEKGDLLELHLGGCNVKSVEMVTPGTVNWSVEGEYLHLVLPLKYQDGLDNIVKLEFDKLPVFKG
ncbi:MULTISPECIES: alpha-L-fucosidase [Halocynthiibacter]|uniref:alpha-L-fucosidase n=1 Tax=Halocynthiibacter halioticoli TaxID=2986804 RepID=A0AAE3IYJ8_9RHOB|nr:MULTISPECIES: alpha-L-fucosidase [Halocynthiibacter]MCV6823490.1 alpha-L-fucosidase [Halocynthiibacter halioticoli]MCW4056491.1 alpha-L-fucosidase [Halocynthiibacter sp. SDUM655004]